MSIYVVGALWVLGLAALAALATILFRRYSPKEGRSGNEAIGTVFGVVGGLHAVILAFVLISLFDAVGTVRDGSYTEANSLVAMYWASGSLPEPARGQVQELTRTYTRTVIDQEWPSMRDGAPVSGAGWTLLDRMRAAIDAAPTDGDWQMDRKTEAANQLWNVYQARQARLTAAGNSGVSAVVWIAIIVGSLLSLLLPYLFDGPKLLTHMAIMGALAGTIALLMFAIYQLQNPFSGGARVEPTAFTVIIDRFVAARAG
jgi:uncharacterized membrane protein